jgi:hypothetical protein
MKHPKAVQDVLARAGVRPTKADEGRQDKNSNKTVEASNVELHISVKSDNNENRLVIKFRR